MCKWHFGIFYRIKEEKDSQAINGMIDFIYEFTFGGFGKIWMG